MKKLNLYIFKQLVVGFLLVTFCLMSIMWLTQSLRFIEMITNKGLSVWVFVELTSLLMPRLFAIISPIALFVGAMFVYNKMLNDRELVVIKAAGIGPVEMAKPVFMIGVIISLFCMYVNNVTIPDAEKAFNDLEWKIKNEISHLMFREGEFTNLQQDLTIFVEEHDADGAVKGVLINDERKENSKSTLFAEKGRIVYTDEGPRIILVNGVRQEISGEQGQFMSAAFDRYSVDMESTGTGKKKDEKAREKTLKELWEAKSDESLTKLERNRYYVEMVKRMMSPMFNLLFALLATVGFIAGSFNRRGQFKIIATSIMAMIVIQAGELAYSNLAVKKIIFLNLYYLNLLVPFLICFYLLLFYNPSKRRKKNKKAWG